MWKPLWRARRGILGGFLGLLIVTLAYVGYLFASYQWPREPLPSADASVGERFVAGEELDSAVGEAEALLVAAREAASLPSISAAVGVNLDLVWAQTIGYADIETRAPAALASRFRLGSTSKALTGEATPRSLFLEKGNRYISCITAACRREARAF